MALSLAEMKDLITFGQAVGLQALKIESLEVHYGASYGPVSVSTDDDETTQEQDQNNSRLPPEMRHYSAQGKAAWGKVP